MKLIAYLIGFIIVINLINSILPESNSNANRSPSNEEIDASFFCVEHQELTKQDCAFNGSTYRYQGNDIVIAPSVITSKE